jgi:hypothetical protein
MLLSTFNACARILGITGFAFALAAFLTVCLAVGAEDPLNARALMFTGIGFGFVTAALDLAFLASWVATARQLQAEPARVLR